MKSAHSLFLVVAVVGWCATSHSAVADTFGSGANSFSIDFVTIGDPGNTSDSSGLSAGAVPYSYRMGKYEISEEMIGKANALGSLHISTDTRAPDRAATSIAWYEAANFVNWLNTSTGSFPAYKFGEFGPQLWGPADVGYDANNRFRNKLAKYFLPSIDEWHKAAYYNPATGTYFAYPTASNAIPDGLDTVGDPNFDAVFYDGFLDVWPHAINNVGVLSPYGTAGQGGNVAEWEETSFDRINDNPTENRAIRGGSWGQAVSLLHATTRNALGEVFSDITVGFRVASAVPEPSTLALVVSLAVFAPRRKARR
jgi:formylglycine-generating enzyme required for sulfatase activity